MSRRTKIIIAILVVLLLMLIAAFFLLRPAPLPPVVNDPQVNTNQPTNSGGLLGNSNTSFNVNLNVPVNTNTAPVPPAEADDRTALRNTARVFAELFGSYSTEGNFENIVDSRYYMSDSVRAWADAYVVEQRAKPRPDGFLGTTTRVLLEPRIESLDLALGLATVTVNTRRIETGVDISQNNVYYQDLTLDFIKVGEAWKVNRFTWGPK